MNQGESRGRFWPVRAKWALILMPGLILAVVFTSCEQLGQLKSDEKVQSSRNTPPDTLTLSKNALDAYAGGASVSLTGLATGATEPFTYSLLSGGGSVTNEGLFFPPNAPGESRVRVTDAAGLSGTIAITVHGPDLTLNFASGSLTAQVAGAAVPNLVNFSRADAGVAKATYFDATGVLRVAAAGSPRFDHDPLTCANPQQTVVATPNCPRKPLGLLLERSASNLVPNGNAFNSWFLSAGIVVTPNAAMGPDGQNSASRIQLPEVFQTAMGLSLVATVGQVYTFSVWAKANGDTDFGLELFGTDAMGRRFVLTNQWQRYSITGTATQTSVVLTFRAGDMSADFLAYGAQLEVGRSPTSYIPTSSGAVARAPDQASITDLGWYEPTRGTFVAEWIKPIMELNESREVFRFHNGTNNEAFNFGQAVATGASRLNVRAGAATVANIVSPTPWVPGGLQKGVIAYSATAVALFESGVRVGEVSVPALPQGLTQMNLGFSSIAPGVSFNGHLRALRYFRERLPDSDLGALSQ